MFAKDELGQIPLNTNLKIEITLVFAVYGVGISNLSSKRTSLVRIASDARMQFGNYTRTACTSLPRRDHLWVQMRIFKHTFLNFLDAGLIGIVIHEFL